LEKINYHQSLESDKIGSLEQGSPTFLKLRATSCVAINAKGFDTHFWNKNLAQFTFSYFSIDIH